MSEGTPEAVALNLFEKIARCERVEFAAGHLDEGYQTVDRAWILDTYAECLRAATGKKHGGSGPQVRQL